MAAAKTLTFTGTIEKAEIKSGKPFDPFIGRYSPFSEYLDFYLDVTLRLEDGRMAYFSTPRIRRVVANCPGAAVVCYSGFDKAGGEWLEEIAGNAVATPGQPNTNDVQAKVKAGDKVTIQARVKAEKVSKANRPYLVLNWVRRQS